MRGFPLMPLFRSVAEGQLAEAQDHLRQAEQDLDDLLAGGERSGFFKAETDPVRILVQAAKQVSLCEAVLKMDDEARAEAEVA